MQNFTPVSLSAAEKSVTVQKKTNKTANKQTHSKLNTPIPPYGGIKKTESKNRDAEKKQCSHKVREVTPEPGRESMVEMICEIGRF